MKMKTYSKMSAKKMKGSSCGHRKPKPGTGKKKKY